MNAKHTQGKWTPLNALQSDHQRRMEEQDYGMIRKCGYMLFWVAAIVLYTGAMYG